MHSNSNAAATEMPAVNHPLQHDSGDSSTGGALHGMADNKTKFDTATLSTLMQGAQQMSKYLKKIV